MRCTDLRGSGENGSLSLSRTMGKGKERRQGRAWLLAVIVLWTNRVIVV